MMYLLTVGLYRVRAVDFCRSEHVTCERFVCHHHYIFTVRHESAERIFDDENFSAVEGTAG